MSEVRPHGRDRILHAAVEALKARRRLPATDPRKRSAPWLRPNYPAAFVLQGHRQRLVDLLLADADLRAETRTILGLGEGGPGDHASSIDLAVRLDRAENPILVLEDVATASDPMVAEAARPYLSGDLDIPSAKVSKLAAAASPTGSRPPDATELRRVLQQSRASERRFGAQVKQLEARIAELTRELASAAAGAQLLEAENKKLQAQLPTRRQRRALEDADRLRAERDQAKRAVERTRRSRSKELQAARTELAESEAQLQLVQSQLEAERKGRRRLERGLGDAQERARRLAPLAEREADAIDKQIAGERPGPERTRLQRRSAALRNLTEALRDLYALDGSDSDPIDSPVNTTLEPGSAVTPLPGLVHGERSLRVTPLGATNHIGGSALLVEAGHTRLLVDAGLRPQAHISHPGPYGIDEAIKDHLDAVVITHAHADHAGYVPWVVERARRAKIICTPQTKALLPTVWADSVRVMRAEADASTRADDPIVPPYGDAEVIQAEEALVAVPTGQRYVLRDLELTFFPAGHILGAAGVVIQAGERRVVITGDIDDRGQASVGPAQIPHRLTSGADLLIIETTYCDSLHNDRSQEGNDLVAEAEDVLAGGGRILIPAFGLGRAQEIALLLGDRLPDVDVLVDGLARDISELYALNDAPEVFRGRVRKVTDRSREIRGFQNGVVITTSGMLTGGAAVPWAEAMLPEPSAALFLCGHQDEEAPGKELELLAQADPDLPRDIRLRDASGRGVVVPVSARVLRYNLSAHADRRGLMSIIDQIRPRNVMLVHGEPQPQRNFQALLEGKGYPVVSNQERWHSDAPIHDIRRARQRHAAKSGRSFGRRT